MHLIQKILLGLIHRPIVLNVMVNQWSTHITGLRQYQESSLVGFISVPTAVSLVALVKRRTT